MWHVFGLKREFRFSQAIQLINQSGQLPRFAKTHDSRNPVFRQVGFDLEVRDVTIYLRCTYQRMGQCLNQVRIRQPVLTGLCSRTSTCSILRQMSFGPLDEEKPATASMRQRWRGFPESWSSYCLMLVV